MHVNTQRKQKPPFTGGDTTFVHWHVRIQGWFWENMRSTHLHPVRLGGNKHPNVFLGWCTFLTLLDVGSIQTCSSLADERWRLPAPRLSRWVRTQKAGHRDGWALSLTLSCPDGSVSRLCIKMGGTLTSGNDEYVNLHPFPLPPTPVERGGMRGWWKHRQGWSCLLDMSVLRFIFDLTHHSSSFSAQITASACGVTLNEN